MKEIKNFLNLKEILDEFKNHDLIVILARYNYGKSSICTDTLINYLGTNKTIYCSFTDQSKPNFQPRKNGLIFGQLVENKTIILDELTDDSERDIEGYVKKLISKNKLIILTNPYGASNDANKEKLTFINNTSFKLPKNCMFVWVQEGIKSGKD